MNSLAVLCRSSPLTPASSSPSPSPNRPVYIKVPRSRPAAHRHDMAAAARISSRTVAVATTAAPPVISPKENLHASLASTSEPPPLFDGTTRLYVAYHCPYTRRAWINRNYKTLIMDRREYDLLPRVSGQD
ncbi:uncharacterized protein LOC112269838 [Brachypodium distachyon]|uniref:uncharacterized protein LOC112269838 n=1 Tax=Brachypodium distachyon TaxID=15368 RepID=UPI000D0D7D17|nr:uncharacterized protein LOC112269838 [Brachypodium distachyon]|eukprot:XP_024312937.1 uncharacterized protein LOC112269838 [Brachypodium distachyon]